jgi:hypothetical protein
VASMTSQERKQFYLRALEDQRHLLRDAIAGMGAGDLTRALNVATAIRVLVHETGNSKPLLKSIQSNYRGLRILLRLPPPPPACPPGIRAVTFYCPISAAVSTAGVVSLITILDTSEYEQSTLGEWWANACMLLPGIGPVTRKELVLGLTNKEGGAHVDAERMPAKYNLLMGSKFVQFRINEINLGPLNIARLVAGKCGVELLDCLDKNFPVPNAA